MPDQEQNHARRQDAGVERKKAGQGVMAVVRAANNDALESAPITGTMAAILVATLVAQ